MSKAVFWQRGETLDYKNAGSEIIEANSVLLIGKRIGIAGMTINPNEVGSVHVTGTFKFPKAAGAITLGAEVYWDATAGKITTTASSNTKAGFAVEAAADAATEVVVKINA